MAPQIKLSPHAVKELSIEKRAELCELPDVLNVFEIASLVYKDDKELLTALIKTIIEACKNDEIYYEIPTMNEYWFINKPNRLVRETSYEDYKDNPLSQYLPIFYVDTDVIIHRCDFKQWFVNQKQWTIDDCLLANWWIKSEVVGNNDTNSSVIKKEKFEHLETTAWKKQAWQIGETWLSEEREQKREHGVDKVAKYVEAKLKNLDIRGRRGNYLDWQTIKKEALTGITGKQANGKQKIIAKQQGNPL